MSIIGSNVLAGASGSGVSAYEIEQSLRFDGSGPSRLTYDNTSGTNNSSSAWTLSFWMKRGSDINSSPYGNDLHLMMWTPSGSCSNTEYFLIADPNHGTTSIQNSMSFNGGGYSGNIANKLRDPNAWYHFVWRGNTGSSSNIIYVNGQPVTAYNQGPSSMTAALVNGATRWSIGDSYTGCSSSPWDGYLAEVHFVDGQTLDHEDFGELDDNGVWRPIRYTGSYGTNGYYLKFDPSASNGVGHDHSGNGHHWTATNVTTSGTGTDVMSDTPTTNWCTLNPLSYGPSNADMIEGNLRFNQPTSTTGNAKGTIAVSSGKWYWEVTPQTTATANCAGGILGADETSTSSQPGSYATGYSYHSTGETRHNNVDATYGDSYGAGDVIGTALDLDAGTLVFYKNGVSQGTAYSSVSGTFVPAIGDTSTGSSSQLVCNFGQREFAHPPGTTSATDYFNTVLYTGNNGTNAITGVGFQPDLVWIKNRTNDNNNMLFDVIRGTDNALISNTTAAEGASVDGTLSAFGSDGFTAYWDGAAGTGGNTNQSSNNYVAWCWKAGGTASSNTDGSITSQVSANNDAGFSIVTWTGTGANGDYGHGLDDVPAMIIHKRRDSTSDWHVWHKSLPTDNPTNDVIYLNLTDGENGGNNNLFRQDPTDTLIYTGSAGSHNTDDATYVDYVWTEKSGVSKFGTYEGTSATNSIDVGFKPALVMIKNADASSQWMMVDTKRGSNEILNPNRDLAEFTASSSIRVNLTQSGFILNGNGTDTNVSGNTYIYAAFAENFSADADYKALNTSNLPEPEIKDGSDYFDTLTYTGPISSTAASGTTGDVTGLASGFTPDLVWIKCRNQANWHQLFDQVRGVDANGAGALHSNSTNSETTTNLNGGLSAFNDGGFTVIAGSDTGGRSNNTGSDDRTYAAWCWDANGSGSSNTDGSITSTVSANPTAGFSIVQFDGTGANGSIGHGLGVAPSFIVAKSKTHADNWFVYHSAIGANGYIMLNQTAAADSPNSTVWQNVSPTSTVFYASTGGYNDSGETIIAYCFAEVEGYSKFGSFTGNGSTDGPFAYCGFKPAWLLTKQTVDDGESWRIYDLKRDTYNAADAILNSNSSGAESTAGSTNVIDILSNGFKVRSNSGEINGSGDTVIFAAFAENPFGGSGVSPATAR